MKRLTILTILLLTAVSTSGCRWIGWGREGDLCNACPAPTVYPEQTFYGGTVDGGQYYGEPMIEGGLPVMPVPEAIPTPAGAR